MEVKYFDDKIAVVTGGGSGIGRALCEELGARGARLVVVDVNAAAAEEVARELTANEIPAVAIGLDVSDDDAVRQLIDETVQSHGRIDFWFNNAGVGWAGPFDEMSLAQIDRLVGISLRAVLGGTAAIYPVMMDQGHGHIVNTASLLGLIPRPTEAVYSAAKHAVVGFSTSLNTEARAHGVCVSVACPGWVNTSIHHTSPAILRGELAAGEGPKQKWMLTAERCAQLILNGVARGKEIIPMAYATPFWWFYRFSPSLFRMVGEPLQARRMKDARMSTMARIYSGSVWGALRLLRTGRLRKKK
ncbi:MAG: SDR family oxidoreductase [Planctomycetota bacterium]